MTLLYDAVQEASGYFLLCWAADAVFRDNLRPHKQAVSVGIGASLRTEMYFLPLYSPEYNSIEPSFSKINKRLHKLKIRDADKLLQVMRQPAKFIAEENCKGYFTHIGKGL